MPMLKLTGKPQQDAEALYRAIITSGVTDVALSKQSGIQHLPTRNTIRRLKAGQHNGLLQALAVLHRLGYRWIIPAKPTDSQESA